MIRAVRTDSENGDFIELVKNLDADLAERDGDDHAFYDQFNKIDKMKFVAVAYENEKPAGCGVSEITFRFCNCFILIDLALGSFELDIAPVSR